MSETDDPLSLNPSESLDSTAQTPTAPIDRIIQESNPIAVEDVYGGHVYPHRRFNDEPDDSFVSQFASSPQMSKLMEQVGFQYI